MILSYLLLLLFSFIDFELLKPRIANYSSLPFVSHFPLFPFPYIPRAWWWLSHRRSILHNNGFSKLVTILSGFKVAIAWLQIKSFVLVMPRFVCNTLLRDAHNFVSLLFAVALNDAFLEWYEIAPRFISQTILGIMKFCILQTSFLYSSILKFTCLFLFHSFLYLILQAL